MTYTVEGLMHGIERAKHNRQVLLDAAEAESKTIADYKVMISQIEEADKKKAEAEANVHVEVEHDGED